MLTIITIIIIVIAIRAITINQDIIEAINFKTNLTTEAKIFRFILFL